MRYARVERQDRGSRRAVLKSRERALDESVPRQAPVEVRGALSESKHILARDRRNRHRGPRAKAMRRLKQLGLPTRVPELSLASGLLRSRGGLSDLCAGSANPSVKA